MTPREGASTSPQAASPAVTRVFTRYFELFRADDAASRDETFRIRYRVYCEERGFLDPAAYPDGREIDAFDRYAVHLLGRHRHSLTAACTARLVLPSPFGFPMAEHCVFRPELAFITRPMAPETERWVEISRLAISKRYRRRLDDDPSFGGPPRLDEADPGQVPEDPGQVPEDAGSEIFAGLYKAAYHESKRLGVTHWLVAMERSLYVMLRRIGHIYVPIGPTVDYYGPVQPYIAEIAEIERSLAKKQPSSFAYWMDGLAPEYRPVWPNEPEGR